MASFADNPAELTKMYGSAVKNLSTGIQHASEGGVTKPVARTMYDALNKNLTFADRLRQVTQVVRDVYSLGDLTDKLGSGLMQAGFESVLPAEIKKANRGDAAQQHALKNLILTTK
jgi:hypothetical protein